MNIWAALDQDLKTTVAAVWPEVTGTFLGVNVAQMNWLNMISSKQIAFPYAIVDKLPCQSSDWGMDNVVYEPEIHMYYLMAQGAGGTQTTLGQKLEAMQDYLMSLTPPASWTMQMYEMLTIDQSRLNAINQSMEQAGMKIISGGIAFRVLIGTTAH